MNGAVAMSSSQASSSSQQYAQGHPSRRENQSTSSAHSRASERDRERSSRANGNPPVESAVTRLLVSIKQLLEALTLWSTLKMTETQVSDVYVRLGNDFNAAVAAFRSFNIDLSELLSVPEDLRIVLEQCLSEEATPSNLEIYLPSVRQIITNLLQGLRSKQSIYRRIISDRKHRTAESQGSEREVRATRSSRADSTSSVGGSSRSHRSVAASESGSVRGSTIEGQQRRIVSSSRKREPTAQLPPPPEGEEGYFSGGFIRPKTPAAEGERAQTSRLETTRSNGIPKSRPSTDYQENVRPRSATPGRGSPLASEDPNDTTVTLYSKDQPPVPDTPPVPPNVVRYSLTDNPVPAVIIDEVTPPASSEDIATMGASRQGSSSPSETPQFDASQAPVIESSLAALKKSDTLERRASKRFSTYNISKMTGAATRERSVHGRSANRRSMAADSNLTPGELNVLTEEDEPPEPGRDMQGARGRTLRTPTPVQEEVPPVPPIPSSSSSSGLTLPVSTSRENSMTTDKRRLSIKPDGTTGESSDSTSNTLTVFLQLGREVKKVKIERGLSFSSLRVLFVDKFSYNPGQDNFPEIYIRDPSSGVMYELEDVEEVKDKCLLSLNIDPLDQIKQHIDQQMSSLTQELKELRSTVGSSKRLSQLPPPPIVTHAFAAQNEVQMPRPSDKQFQNIARRLSRLVGNGESSPPPLPNGVVPQMTGTTLQPQFTGGSVLSEASGRIVNDLKTQFDEVQNLRRDLGVMRQLYVDFISHTKESLGTLRSQTQAVRQLSNSKVGGARSYINAGKPSLDQRTQNALTRVEELQDTVETLKEDVLKRFVSPRSNLVKTVAKDIAEVSAELDKLKEYIGTVKPMWKKTWEEELQNIVEEQQFLTHQEEFLQDLLEDHKALSEVFGHVEKVITLRSTGAGRSRSFRPPPPDEGHGGLTTVMMEIRSAAVDPERRIKAIEASQKAREREKAGKSDEFESELKNFVSSKKLKLTGGAEEVERMRQKRNDMALKAMFNSSQTNVAESAGARTPTSAGFPSDASGSPRSPSS